MAAPRTKFESAPVPTPGKWLFAPRLTAADSAIPADFKITVVTGKGRSPGQVAKGRADTTGANTSHANCYYGVKNHRHNASFKRA